MHLYNMRMINFAQNVEFAWQEFVGKVFRHFLRVDHFTCQRSRRRIGIRSVVGQVNLCVRTLAQHRQQLVTTCTECRYLRCRLVQGIHLGHFHNVLIWHVHLGERDNEKPDKTSWRNRDACLVYGKIIIIEW